MHLWRGVTSDLVLASRSFRRSPGFTLVCLITLALGIGGNTAVFTLIDRVMLTPLPVQAPSELYRLGGEDDCCVNSGLPGSFSLFSYDLYRHLRDAAPEFSSLAAFQANPRAITLGRPGPGGAGETFEGVFVSGNYFQMLGVAPAAGRLIQLADDERGAAPVAVLNHRTWTERFGGRTDVVGSTVLLNGVTATIVGVAPAGFFGETLRPNPAEMWVPIAAEPRLQPAARLAESRPLHWLYVIGRLRDGVDLAPLETKLTAEVQRWITSALELSADERARVPQQHVRIVSAEAGVTNMRDIVAPSLRLLQAIAAAVLLIACANLANLLIAQGLARRSETAVRIALGAPRARLVRQFLVESTLLACLGGLAGLGVAYAGAQAIVGLAFRGAPGVPLDPSPSPAVLGFAVLVSLATGIVFGCAPALVGSRSDPVEAMRGAGRSTADRGSRLRRSLIALQVAMSLVLLTCAGLLARSLSELQAQDFGFRSERRHVASLAPSLSTVPPEALPALYARLQERLRRVPGVANAGFSLYGVMSGDNWSSLVTVDGHAPADRLIASWNRVSPRYFDTIGTPVLRGRAFDERDRHDAALVAVVSEGFARTFFGDADPIGRRIGFTDSRGTGSREFEIVGVVGDARYQDGWRPPRPTFFLPFLQQTAAGRAARAGGGPLDPSHYPQAIVIQTTGAVPGLEREVRRALAEVDRRLIVRSFVTLDEQIARTFNLERLIARLSAAFGGIALLLACLGLYGVTSYSVARRTREIGIRMAVGAPPRAVLATVLRSALGQLAIGVALGLPAAVAAGRLLQSRLFGVTPGDPATVIGGIGVLTAAAAVAALIPARRAASLDPVRALRIE
jgi:predicted permease